MSNPNDASPPVIKKDPIVKEVKVEKDVHVVQPVIHRQVEQTHVHPHVEHKYERAVQPSVTHGTQEHQGHASTGGPSVLDKVKSFFTHDTHDGKEPSEGEKH